MSSTTMYDELTNSHLASEDWLLTKEDAPKPPCLAVQLRRSWCVLPYFRFIYASGDESQVVIAFSSHVVTVTGHGLAALLVALADTRVSRLIEPTENEAKFGVRGPNAVSYRGPAITAITVEEVEEVEQP
jgi:hypothetical protein